MMESEMGETVALRERGEVCTGFWWRNPRERKNHSED